MEQNNNKFSLWMKRLDWFVDLVVIANAAVILFHTGHWIPNSYEPLMETFFSISNYIFIIEILLRILFHRKQFFKDWWNIFDFTIVLVTSITLVPNLMTLRLLRVLRLIRLLRLFSINAPIRNLTTSLMVSFSRVIWTSIFFTSLYTIYATIGIDLFKDTHPEYFGTIGNALFSLFQIMTLESWASDIARTVMEAHPYAWIYFVSFILITTYILLNLLFGIITSTIIEVYEGERREEFADSLKAEIRTLQQKLDHIEEVIRKQDSNKR